VRYAPQVTTLTASNLVVGSDGCVMFRGTVNPGQLPTIAWFEWGASTGYSNVTEAILLDTTNVAVSVSNLLCGLVPGSDYHVRLVASNSLGAVTVPAPNHHTTLHQHQRRPAGSLV